ncbi:MAG: AI-2E family transporter [Phycisphaerae bacterium]
MAQMDHYLPPLSPTARHWVRSIAVFAAIVLLLWAAYVLRPVLTPLLVALVIAYILNPVVSWLERHNARRLLVVIVIYAILAIVLATVGVIVALKTFGQIVDFQANFDRYLETITSWIRKVPFVQWDVGDSAALSGVPRTANESFDQLMETMNKGLGTIPYLDLELNHITGTDVATSQPTGVPGTVSTSSRWLDRVTPMLREHGIAVLNSAVLFLQALITNVTNLVSVLILIPMYSFFFLWRFDDIVNNFRDHLPARYRDTVIYFVRTIDRAISQFFRGRLIVCTIIGLVNALGWHFVGVRNGLLLGMISGILSLVPFMSFLAVPPAVFFRYVAAVDAGQPWVTPVMLTFGVYLATQALESFLLSPQIEGKAAGLHPITTIVALMIGAQVAGVLGMLLSIPLASTVKTFAVEFVLPEIRKLARDPVEHDPQMPDDPVIEATPVVAPLPVAPAEPQNPKK